MEKRIYPEPALKIISPEPYARRTFSDAREAVEALKQLYARNTEFLRSSFATLAREGEAKNRYRAYYPEVGVTTTSYSHVDTRQAYCHLSIPGHFTTTITRPDLFETYLIEQLQLLIRNHNVPVVVSESDTPIPLHFAFLEGTHVDGSVAER